MKYNDIKQYDYLIECYHSIEKNIYETLNKISLESNIDVVSEMINDLNDTITSTLNEHINTDKELISESLVKFNEINLQLKKEKRGLYRIEKLVESLASLYNIMDNTRKNIVLKSDNSYNGMLLESYNNISHKVSDLYLSLIKEEFDIACDESTTDILNAKIIGLLEGTEQDVENSLTNIQNAFSTKHDKIVERDQEWLRDNKDELLSIKYDEVELEVPTDIDVSFANLINRHNTFDKNFTNVNTDYDTFYQKVKKYEDKNTNLRNGLDNYFRSGNARREVGTKKVSSNNAKNAVTNMIAYCEEFLSGKGDIESKINSIISDIGKSSKNVKECYEPLFENYYDIVLEKATKAVKLSDFKKYHIDKYVIEKHRDEYKGLKHLNVSKYHKGFMYIDDDKVVAVINVNTETSIIQALEVMSFYKGNKLSYQLLDVAVKELKANELSVNKKNKLAIHVYEKYGFKTYKEDGNMLYMKLKNSIKETYLLEANKEDTGEEPVEDEAPEEETTEKNSSVDDFTKIFRDRQTGVTTLMTVLEARYFDYIGILKGLME